MKSDLFQLNQETSEVSLLAEVERTGLFCHLREAEALRLRLLAEEMLSLTKRLLTYYDCRFWVENKEKQFELHLQIQAALNQEQKDKLLSLSKSGENTAAKGILGKINSVLDNFLLSEQSIPAGFGYHSYAPGMAVGLDYSYMWSLRDYQQEAPAETRQTDWDGLEKSILASFADDLTIGIRSNQVEMIAKISFDA